MIEGGGELGEGGLGGELEAASAGDHPFSVKVWWTDWSGRCMMLAIMKQPVPDVVWHGSRSGVPGVGIPGAVMCGGVGRGNVFLD
jgi:hypothetical protein